MSRTGSFIFRLLVALVLLAGLVGVVTMAFRSGYSQGYVLGAAADGDGEQLTYGVPMMPGIVPYHRAPFFPPVGLFFCGGMLFLFLLGALFRPRHWHRYPGKAKYHWHGPWGWHHWMHEYSQESEKPSHTTANDEQEDNSSDAV